MATISSIAAVTLAVCLLGLACRHCGKMWITADDTILCFISPGLIMLSTFGVLAFGWRLTHGGLSDVSIGAWIGSVIIVGLMVGAWFLIAPRIRAYKTA